jgi:apolipoprotein N-acyltransferase
VLIVGDGGKYVEALPDSQVVLPPFDTHAIRAALRKLRIAPLLDGIRGDPPLDTAAFCDAASRVGQLMRDPSLCIDSLDINPILVGAQEYPDTGGRYNVLLLWQPGRGVIARYAKQHPAPFGEYIPMRGFARLFTTQVDEVSIDMLRGAGTAVMDLPTPRLGRDVRLGTVICFEVAYEPLVNAAIRAGAQLLVVPTNNASFGYSAESTQQLAMSRLRAITTGRATVQVSTVGVSGIIAPDGTLTQRTDLFTAAQLVATLPLRTTITPAVHAGNWPAITVVTLAALGLALALGSALLARRRSTPSTESVPKIAGQ